MIIGESHYREIVNICKSSLESGKVPHIAESEAIGIDHSILLSIWSQLFVRRVKTIAPQLDIGLISEVFPESPNIFNQKIYNISLSESPCWRRKDI